jgi:class 3 adenylate cyclase
MAAEGAARRLAAIMFTDIVGYTALMAESEERAMGARARHRELVRPLVERHGGQWIEETGDESLSCFPSALDAVTCALAVQDGLRGDAELNLRIGIHLGDVVFEGDRVYGDGVNVASRIRPLAEPGGICVSGEVQKSIRNQPEIEAMSLGWSYTYRPLHLPRVSHG